MHLPGPGPLALCTLEAQEITTKGVYRLLHAIYTNNSFPVYQDMTAEGLSDPSRC